MVNSGSFDCDMDRNIKDGFTQPGIQTGSSESPYPATATSVRRGNTDSPETADNLPLSVPAIAQAIEPTATKTEFNTTMFSNSSEMQCIFTSRLEITSEYSQPVENLVPSGRSPRSVSVDDVDAPNNHIRGVFCSVPLDKVPGLLSAFEKKKDENSENKKIASRKLMCLYCDRTFVTTNLRQKHVDRCHSVKQTRSSRRLQSQPTSTACVYCDKLNGSDHNLKQLFLHLISSHPNKYFACLACEDRFSTLPYLNDHNASTHQVNTVPQIPECSVFITNSENDEKLTRSKFKMKTIGAATTEYSVKVELDNHKNRAHSQNKHGTKKTLSCVRELRSKRFSVKGGKMGVRRTTRLQSRLIEHSKTLRKNTKTSNKTEEIQPKTVEKQILHRTNLINPYPQFDSYFQVKKITDHSIDNLRISTLTFDDVFDKAFYNRIKCNIRENLLNYIDGKLFKNEESENRISNFEKNCSQQQELPNQNIIENYGCELTLNAATPVAMLLSTQFGEDFESQIEYGSKASKKRTQTKTDEVRYKYLTRRKYQASILESKENRDLSKLDMWTQLIIKNRQQKIANDKKSPKELLDYTKCLEYKTKLQQEELNRILDKRGPFEDLKEEATKKAALDKLNLTDDSICQESFSVVTDILNDIINKICEESSDLDCIEHFVHEHKTHVVEDDEDIEIPSYLKLKRSSSVKSEDEIDKSDKITLICSSQETENFEVPNVPSRNKNELVELTGEWARARIYVCAACGLKLPNLKLLTEHKTLIHQNVWCQHYEFVGNQSELYRHLSIPALGKVGVVERDVTGRFWQRSDARLCTKCLKQCHTLGELHRHILECGEDWTWMLARKKCKYRPYGAKTRRKRRGLVKRAIHSDDQKPREKRRYKKRFEGPKSKPSDVETIQRMLANLPAKRITRKIMSLKDGFPRTSKTKRSKEAMKSTLRSKQLKSKKLVNHTTSRNGFKTKTRSQSNTLTRRRSLRKLSTVLSSRILDTNSTLIIKRKLKSAISSTFSKNINTFDTFVTDDYTKSSSKLPDKVKDEKETELLDSNSPSSKPRKKKLKEKEKQDFTESETGIKRFFPVRKTRSIQQNAIIFDSTPCKTEVPVTKKLNLKSNKPKFNESDVTGENVTVHKKVKVDVTEGVTSNSNVRKSKLIKNKIEETVDAPKKDDSSKRKLSTKRKVQNSIEGAVKKLKQVTLENMPVMKPRKDIIVEKNKTGKLLRNKKNIRIENMVLCNNSEFEKMPQLEKVPNTPETYEGTAELPVLTPVALNFENSAGTEVHKKDNEDTTAGLTERDEESVINGVEEKDIKSEVRKVEDADHVVADIKLETNAEKQPRIEEKSVNSIIKGKPRKPSRKLNDCIAMLTNKLQQKVAGEAVPEMVEKITVLPEDTDKVLCEKEKDCTNMVNSSTQTVSNLLDQAEENISFCEVLSPEPVLENNQSLNQVSEKISNTETGEELVKRSTVDEIIEKVALNLIESAATVSEHFELTCDAKNEGKKRPARTFPKIKNLGRKIGQQRRLKNRNGAVSTTLQKKVENVGKRKCKKSSTRDGTTENIQSETIASTTTVGEERKKTKNIHKRNYKKSSSPVISTKNIQSEAVVSTTVSGEVEKPENNLVLQDDINKSSESSELENKLFNATEKSQKNINPESSGLQNQLLVERSIGEQETDSEDELPLVALKKSINNELGDNSLPGDKESISREPAEVSNVLPDLKVISKSPKRLLKRKPGKRKSNKTRIDKTIEESTITNHINENTSPDYLPPVGMRKRGRKKKNPQLNQISSLEESQNFVSSIISDISNLISVSPIPKKDNSETEQEENKSIQSESLVSENMTIMSEDVPETSVHPHDYLTQHESIISSKLSENCISGTCATNLLTNTKLNEIVDELKSNNNGTNEIQIDETTTLPKLSESFESISGDSNEDKNKLSEIATISTKRRSTRKSKHIESDEIEIEANKPQIELDSPFKTPKVHTDTSLITTPDLDDQFISQQLSKNLKIKTKGRKPKKNNKKLCTLDASESKEFVCNICDKKFVRNDNLVKHMRTLTHIAKLSEIEANEASQRIRTEITEEVIETNPKLIDDISENTVQITEESTKTAINICSILNNSSRYVENKISEELQLTPSSFSIHRTTNSTLKLADIINEVLNKPVEENSTKHASFSDIILQSPNDGENPIRRYKSLGERKSFESDIKTSNLKDFADTFSEVGLKNSMFTKNADSILEKQISLLENIIENRTALDYIDDISISSVDSATEDILDKTPSLLSCVSDTKPNNSNRSNLIQENLINKFVEPSTGNFVKPTQYEEISEDSVNFHNHYDDQKARKALNRDEELFLECCSLLKSGSEISNYSRKSNKESCALKNFQIKPANNECPWLEHKNFSMRCQLNDSSNFMSDTSRIPTPLGDNFADDGCSSNTMTFNWQSKTSEGENCEKPDLVDHQLIFEDISDDKNLSEKETPNTDEKELVLNFKDIHFPKDTENLDMSNGLIDCNKEASPDEKVENDNKPRSFGEVMVKALRKGFNSIRRKSKHRSKRKADVLEPENELPKENMPETKSDGKKPLTKGAMKVFEGLKVSIPTEDLNITELLNRKVPAKPDECLNVREELNLSKEEEEVQCATEAVSKTNHNYKRNKNIHYKLHLGPKTKVKRKIKRIGKKLSTENIKKIISRKVSSNEKTTKQNQKVQKSMDVYDFEETQDNSDIFNTNSLSLYRSFKTQLNDTLSDKKFKENVEVVPAAKSSDDLLESLSFEAHSVSSISTTSNTSAKLIEKTGKTVTKKKGLIVGRIFKNALKTKLDDEIREIPIADNNSLVTDYVLSCPPHEEIAKPKMSEKELDMLFNKLFDNENVVPAERIVNKENQKDALVSNDHMQKESVKKVKKPVKVRKRQRHNSNSTDDEFSISKPCKKRTSKKNIKNIDNSINLEQELKECIGVASRKSQRKCTSGKQNVLVEFWSSDESISEAVLEIKHVEEKIIERIPTPIPEPTPKADYVSENKTEQTKMEKPAELPKLAKQTKGNFPKKKSKARAGGFQKDSMSQSHIENSATNRRKRTAANTLYYWSSSSEDEFQDMIELKPIRDEIDEDDCPIQHGWIVGDSPKKLVTMLAQAKGNKRLDADSVKEQARNRNSILCS